MKIRDITIIPDTNRFSLFLSAISVVFIFTTDYQMRLDLERTLHWIDRGSNLRKYLLILPFSIGLLYSITCVIKKRISKGGRYSMMVFGVMSNAFGGVCAGYYIFQNTMGWMLIFPIWNMFCAIMPFIALRAGLLNETLVVDCDASMPEVVIYAIVAIGIILIGQYLGSHWSIIYSVCLVYSESVVRILKQSISHLYPRNDAV